MSSQSMENQGLDKEAVKYILRMIKINLNKIWLDQEKKAEIQQQVKIIEAQMEADKHDQTVTKGCFQTIKNNLAEARCSLRASALIYKMGVLFS